MVKFFGFFKKIVALKDDETLTKQIAQDVFQVAGP